ncbi:MAG: CDP-diacylglycerol--serine O-phosphatidyltransferase [Candidatus Coatesbacteria bacterium]|nr:CDP-diacylglycerol--serine O-phosphatidyltransferase [Candidatus Coatesbacteria bacterium]
MNINKKAIYLLPNIITTSSLVCGVLSILNSTSNNFFIAAILIIAATAIDGLDGTVARITKTNSIFGLNYDSLADLICFGVAPGILYYNRFIFNHPLNKIVMASALLFIVCGALRLARYNTFAQDPDKKTVYFLGLPIPVAAGFITSFLIIPRQMGLNNNLFFILSTIFIIISSVLMVSTLRFFNLKKIYTYKHQNFELLVLLIMIITFIIMAQAHLFQIIFFIGFLYILSGPFDWLIYRYRKATGTYKCSESSEHTDSASDK